MSTNILIYAVPASEKPFALYRPSSYMSTLQVNVK
jgi:hypothetical protein